MADGPETTLDAWEIADPLRALRFHGERQAYAGSQMKRCMESNFVRFCYGADQLLIYQSIQSEAFRKMVALREVLTHSAMRGAASA